VSDFSRDNVVVRSRREWIFAVMMALCAILPMLLDYLPRLGRPWSLGPPLGLTTAAVLLFFFWPKVHRGRLTVEDGQVRVDGRAIFVRSNQLNAQARTRKGQSLAEIWPGFLQGFGHEVALASEEDVRVFLAALKLDVAHRTTKLVVSFGRTGTAMLRRLAITLPLLPVLWRCSGRSPRCILPSWSGRCSPSCWCSDLGTAWIRSCASPSRSGATASSSSAPSSAARSCRTPTSSESRWTGRRWSFT
jgi:hypothetical protein